MASAVNALLTTAGTAKRPAVYFQKKVKKRGTEVLKTCIRIT